MEQKMLNDRQKERYWGVVVAWWVGLDGSSQEVKEVKLFEMIGTTGKTLFTSSVYPSLKLLSEERGFH